MAGAFRKSERHNVLAFLSGLLFSRRRAGGPSILIRIEGSLSEKKGLTFEMRFHYFRIARLTSVSKRNTMYAQSIPAHWHPCGIVQLERESLHRGSALVWVRPGRERAA